MMLSLKIYIIFMLLGSFFLGMVGLSFLNCLSWFSIFLVIFLVLIYPEAAEISSWGVLDSMSNGLVILSSLITLLMIYSSFKVLRYHENTTLYYWLMLFLLGVLVFSFFTDDMLMFYFYFEVSLIPTLLIILGWGYQPERLQAGVYFMFYTLFASLPLLLFINYSYYIWGGLNLFTKMLFELTEVSTWGDNILGGLVIMSSLAFLVKLPIYYGHLWLPKAHVEAPVAGSMILAGVLLKLGGYGLMRVGNFIIIGASKLSWALMGLGLASMVYVGVLCVRLNDFKALVAYSSVAHMAMVICGIFSFYWWGWVGSFIMMVAHGVSSSGLFCMVNLYYERTASRSFYINKGLLLIFPLFTLFLFLMSAANIAAPPTMNLVSEIFLMASILSFDKFMLLVFPVGSFLGAVFTLFMFSYSQHGAIYNYLYGLGMPNMREFHILALHLIPVNVLFLNTSLFLLL